MRHRRRGTPPQGTQEVRSSPRWREPRPLPQVPPRGGRLYRSLTGYVVKLKTDAGKVRYLGPRGMARLQSRAKRFESHTEAKYAAESAIGSGYGKVRSASVVRVVAKAKKAAARKRSR